MDLTDAPLLDPEAAPVVAAERRRLADELEEHLDAMARQLGAEELDRGARDTFALMRQRAAMLDADKPIDTAAGRLASELSVRWAAADGSRDR